MRLFVWRNVEYVSRNWHHDGGLAVIAADLESARERITAEVHADEPCEALTVAPDYECECTGPAQVFVFPNAGCC